MKKALQMKGVSSEQAEKISKELTDNPQIVDSLKALEANKEVKELFQKIQKEVEEKKKAGMAEMYASVLVMGKYKSEITKHRDVLEPLMHLMQK
jgi:cell fate (sporulation/competence/biofilm development) regulator YlbF (YheA/YmcA/DUF963 family)